MTVNIDLSRLQALVEAAKLTRDRRLGHDYDCSVTPGDDVCNCGLYALREAVDAFETPPAFADDESKRLEADRHNAFSDQTESSVAEPTWKAAAMKASQAASEATKAYLEAQAAQEKASKGTTDDERGNGNSDQGNPMIYFESGHTLNPTSHCYDNDGKLVLASQIAVGEKAWTAGHASPLGKRIERVQTGHSLDCPVCLDNVERGPT